MFKADDARRMMLKAQAHLAEAARLRTRQARQKASALRKIRDRVLDAAFNGYASIQLFPEEEVLEAELWERGFFVKWKKNDQAGSRSKDFAAFAQAIHHEVEKYKKDMHCEHPMLDKMVFAMDAFDRYWRVGVIPAEAYVKQCEDLRDIFENKYLRIFGGNDYTAALSPLFSQIRDKIASSTVAQGVRVARLSWTDADERISELREFLKDENNVDTMANDFTLPFANRQLIKKYLAKFSRYEGRYFSGPGVEWLSSTDGKQFFKNLSSAILRESSKASPFLEIVFRKDRGTDAITFGDEAPFNALLEIDLAEFMPLIKRFGYACHFCPGDEQNVSVLRVSWG